MKKGTKILIFTEMLVVFWGFLSIYFDLNNFLIVGGFIAIVIGYIVARQKEWRRK